MDLVPFTLDYTYRLESPLFDKDIPDKMSTISSGRVVHGFPFLMEGVAFRVGSKFPEYSPVECSELFESGIAEVKTYPLGERGEYVHVQVSWNEDGKVVLRENNVVPAILKLGKLYTTNVVINKMPTSVHYLVNAESKIIYDSHLQYDDGVHQFDESTIGVEYLSDEQLEAVLAKEAELKIEEFGSQKEAIDRKLELFELQMRKLWKVDATKKERDQRSRNESTSD